MNRLNNKFILTSKVFLYLLPILGIAGITVPLIIGQNNLSILGIYLAIPMILAPIIYIKQSKRESSFTILNRKLFSLLISLYFICTFISIYLIYTYDVRPHTYHFIIAIMSGLILLEIILFDISNKMTIIILVQIMILLTDIIWGVTLNYNFYISRTDPMAHVWWIQNLINTGYVTEIFGIYKPFPLWHILVTVMYNILGAPLSTQKMMFFTNGFIYSLVPVMAFLISIRIFKDKKIALLSALFVAIYPDVIAYGMSSIARSVVSLLEIMLILVLLDQNSIRKITVAIILIVPLILYHTASVPFILAILLAIYILEKIYAKEKTSPFLTPTFIILFICTTIAYWMYKANVLFEELINTITTSAPTGVITKSIIYTPFSEVFNYLQYSPLFFFIIIGFFGTLQSKKISGLGKIFCIIGLFAVSVSFPGPGLLLNKLADSFNLARFGEYTLLFIGLTGAIGFYEIYNKSKKHAKVLIILLFIAMSFLSVSNDFTASDNPLIKRPFYTYYLTNGEEVAFRHIASSTQGHLLSDYVTTRYLLFSPYENKTHILEVDIKKMKILRIATDDVLLIRSLELTKRPLKLYSAPDENFRLDTTWSNHLDYYYQDSILWDSLISYNKIYESNDVTGFT